MKDLLPFYEAELQRLRASASEFAGHYPKIASRLQLGADASEDPHVERLIQSFALLAARAHKRIDDDFPQFTESLLNVLYPHYLRPFPACSIVKFGLSSQAVGMSVPVHIARGTELTSRPVRRVACRFRTASDVRLAPVVVQSVSYRHLPVVPSGIRLPVDATAMLSVQLSRVSPLFPWALLGPTLRVFLDGERSQVAWLREVLGHRVKALLVERDGSWSGPHPQRPALAGFGPDEALIDYDERSHPAYRLLAEYFTFPEKFNFLDLPLPFNAPGLPGETAQAQAITLHFALSGMDADSDAARLLETLSEKNLVLGCTPIVNLFTRNAEPIKLDHTATEYPVVVDARNAHGHEVYAIDKVLRVVQSAQGEVIHELRPFFSLHHEDLIGETDGQPSGRGRYWHLRRDDVLASTSPGHEQLLTVVDTHFDPVKSQRETLSLTVTATNRQLPSLLTFGAPGELQMDGGAPSADIRMLRKPTPSHQFDRGQGNAWRLVSHLALNHLSLSGRGIEALREMLHLYDLPRDAINRRQINGLVAVSFSPAMEWMAGKPFASFVRGTEIRLSVDEEAYVGIGLGLFVAVLDRFFSLYAHVNSFTRLIVMSSRTQQVLYTCPPRIGDQPLV